MAFSEVIKKHHAVFAEKHLSVIKSHKAPSITDFEIIKPISRGAFGQVYLSRRKGSKIFFALKSMKKSDLLNKNMMEQVIAERDALAISSKSPYVVQLYYSFQTDEKIFLVMEYMIGGDLKSLLHNLGFFDETMAVFYIAEITLALQYLHEHFIYHRDIKPDNMLLSTHGHVKLTDFGLSCLTSERKPLSYADLMKTPGPGPQNNNKQISQSSHIFWRTPGQLQSLTSKFTFSYPDDKSKMRKHSKLGMIKDLDDVKEYNFSPPEVRNNDNNTSQTSLLSTPRIKQSSSTPNAVLNTDGHSNLKHTGLTCDIDTLSLQGLQRKRCYQEIEEKENITLDQPCKRPRVTSLSMPCEFELSDRGNIRTNVVKFDDKIQHHYCEDYIRPKEECNNIRPKEEYNSNVSNEEDPSVAGNISGVSVLTETSKMSLSMVSSPGNEFDHLNLSANEQYKETPVYKFTPSPLQQQNIKSSPSLTPKNIYARDRTNSDVVITPVQMLKFFDGPTPEHSSKEESSESLFKTPNGDLSIDSNVCFKNANQTPFRTPKSCLRGKKSHSERKKVLGTPDYLAPEVLLGIQHGAPVDWWALGVCFFEFLTGVPPFNDDTAELVFQHILDRDLIWPENDEKLSDDVVQAIEALLTEDPNKRASCVDIKSMKSFSAISWFNLHSTPAPFLPQPDNVYDTTYFNAKNLANHLKMSEFQP